MSAPPTYVDGAGRERCATCGEIRKGMSLKEGGYCSCNNYEERNIKIDLGKAFPEIGEEMELLSLSTGTEYKIRVCEIASIKWKMPAGKTPYVLVRVRCRFLDVTKNGKPKLKLIK